MIPASGPAMLVLLLPGPAMLLLHDAPSAGASNGTIAEHATLPCVGLPCNVPDTLPDAAACNAAAGRYHDEPIAGESNGVIAEHAMLPCRCLIILLLDHVT